MEEAHIAFVSTPGMGHIIPLVELAKRLITQYSFTATLILPAFQDAGPVSTAQNAFLQSHLPAGMDYLLLPPVPLHQLPPDARPVTRMCRTMDLSLPALREALQSLMVAKTRRRLVALAVDLFSTGAFDVADELGIMTCVFSPSAAFILSFTLYLPELDSSLQPCDEFRDLPTPVQIPGFSVPVHGKDLIDPVQDRQDETYTWVLHHAKRLSLAQAIMVNSFNEAEQGAVKALQESVPPVYLVGPLVRMDSSSNNNVVSGDDECLQWLDEQPEKSVLFVSFGSGGTLSHQQLIELALGLEMSEQRFVWVIRSPSENSSMAFFSTQDPGDPLSFLPEGFAQRIKNKVGVVVPNWAPQHQILSHPSTGGFLTHCGWNSILESIAYGMPLVAWPLYAEQKMNALLLTDDLNVALRPKASDENGLVGREEISRVVKGLMASEQGKKMREKMGYLKDAGLKAIGDEDGSSTKALDQVVSIWKSKLAKTI
ncbi:PREDICTED: hydroquinone glucosyltransferase-like [Ipomoea nil]|uniref:hydroquinone glucosyltransferase-like n=1 Tax=Ipomoea nil TaxID=35883 RepID=UPI000900F1E8|nr:PREDICTED: hydroquinone glucosyltransferase-like [Ipomoea nil]